MYQQYLSVNELSEYSPWEVIYSETW